MSFTTGMPVARVSASQRVEYLQKVLLITALGLGISGVTGMVSAAALSLTPALLSGYAPMLLILGCWAVTNFVARPMVFGSAKWPGFLLGTLTQGVAMGFLLLVAMLVSRAEFGNPFVFISVAMAMTGFTGVGMAAYVWTGPRNFSMIGAGLSAMAIPMMILMAVSFAFPALLGGTLGLLMSFVFVGVSAAGLLYQVNEVIHRFSTDQHVEAAYTITIGVLVLFWNLLSLLMRLRRR
jgi:FtsH-binding integral membrane protein